MDDFLSRMVENLDARIHGPLSFRFLLQPAVAILYAIWDGYRDARQGKPAYFWALFTQPDRRREMLAEGWTSIGKVFVVALLIDAAYQYIALRWFYPGEAVVVALLLAIVPYVALRGPVNRIVRALWRTA